MQLQYKCVHYKIYTKIILSINENELNSMLLHLHFASYAILYGTKRLFYFHYICYNNKTLKKSMS